MLVLCVLYVGVIVAEYLCERTSSTPCQRPPRPTSDVHDHITGTWCLGRRRRSSACVEGDVELGPRAGDPKFSLLKHVDACACQNDSRPVEPPRRPSVLLQRLCAFAKRASVCALRQDPFEAYRCLDAPLETPAAARYKLQRQKRLVQNAKSLLRVGAYLACVFLLPLTGLSEGVRALLLVLSLLECLRDKRTRSALRYLSSVVVYLTFFSEQASIPANLRPPPNSTLLPAWDVKLIGARADEIFAASHSVPLDILAGVCYGVLHYVAPFGFFLFLWSRSTSALKVAARAFGRMNTLAVLIQVLFPNTPPWFESVYGKGTVPVYGMAGNAAGLLRVDALLHFDFFGPAFAKSPLVFGSWPSLHCAWPVFFSLFAARVDRRFLLLSVPHALWVAWAVLYLKHHFLCDVLAGQALAWATYFSAREGYLRAVRGPCKCECDGACGEEEASPSSDSASEATQGSAEGEEREAALEVVVEGRPAAPAGSKPAPPPAAPAAPPPAAPAVPAAASLFIPILALSGV